MARHFIAVPLALLGAYVVAIVIGGGNVTVVYACVAAAKLCGAAGLLAATLRYNRREYLFWAWALQSANMFLLGVTELFFTRRLDLLHLDPALARTLWAALIVVANIMAAVGTLMLARVWRVVGIALPDESRGKKALVLAGIVVAVAIVGYVTIPSWKALLHGDPDGVVGSIGSVSDMVCFALIAPLALRAVALRGGTLAWPWGLFASSALTWMIFDILAEIDLPLPDTTARALSNGVRIAACLLSMAAGMAQRWATQAPGAEAAAS